MNLLTDFVTWASYLNLAQERIESWERFDRPASAREE